MSANQAFALLLGLASIILAASLLGRVARWLGQPAVIGEVLAGILIGPTLFGGAIGQTLLPADIRPFLSALASVGVAVFMFLVGLELDRELLRGSGRAAVSISLTSILLPCTLGIGLGTYLLRTHESSHALGFVLFMGVAMSITAFPVLARILTDRGMNRSPLGGLALTCAAIDDVLAWSLLAAVVTVLGADVDQWRILLLIPYLLVMLVPVRLGLRWLIKVRHRAGQMTPGLVGIVLAGLLASAAATEWLGLHYMFGAFMFGIVMPRRGAAALRQELDERIGLVSNVLLLPVFFIVAGLKVNLSGLTAVDLTELGLILAVAIGGKFIGAFIAAKANRLSARSSATIATLMNTRGLTELIILSVGLQLGVLDVKLYSLMVVMAVVTTAMAGPVLALTHPRRLNPVASADPTAKT
ncbi:MAG TPA: cation:proton antiporter [Micromonosporaceae bacterium]